MKRNLLDFEKTKKINKIAATALICAVSICSESFISFAVNGGSELGSESSTQSDLSVLSSTTTEPPCEKPDSEDQYLSTVSDATSVKSGEPDTISITSGGTVDDTNHDTKMHTTISSAKATAKKLQPLTLEQLSESAFKKKLLSLQENNTLEFGSILSAEDKTQLFSYLKSNPHFTSLALISREIDDEDAHKLADAIRANSTLTQIDLSHNSISDSGIRTLMSALEENSSIAGINLNHNLIGDEGARIIAKTIKTLNRQTDIIIKNNPMSNGCTKQITIAMLLNPSYQKVSLSWLTQPPKATDKPDVVSKRLSDSLSHTAVFINSLQSSLVPHVDFSGCNWFKSDLKVLTDFLSENQLGATTHLNLSNTGINSSNLKILTDALKTNTTITSIDLSNNAIENLGAELIADMLQSNHTLTEIHLQNAGINDDGMNCLLPSLTRNLSIRDFDLIGNNICTPTEWHEIKHPMTITLSFNPELIPTCGHKNVSYQMTKQNQKDILVITITDSKK